MLLLLPGRVLPGMRIPQVSIYLLFRVQPAPAPDAEMKHLVLTGVKDGENVVWKEKVSDADYRTPATTVHHSD